VSAIDDNLDRIKRSLGGNLDRPKRALDTTTEQISRSLDMHDIALERALRACSPFEDALSRLIDNVRDLKFDDRKLRFAYRPQDNWQPYGIDHIPMIDLCSTVVTELWFAEAKNCVLVPANLNRSIGGFQAWTFNFDTIVNGLLGNSAAAHEIAHYFAWLEHVRCRRYGLPWLRRDNTKTSPQYRHPVAKIGARRAHEVSISTMLCARTNFDCPGP